MPKNPPPGPSPHGPPPSAAAVAGRAAAEASWAPRPLRTHQRQLAEVVAAIASGQASGVRDILAAVTPGGGKSLLPVLAAHALAGAGIVERICWVVPRDSLRLQAEEAFADPIWRKVLGHKLSVRAAENAPDPCRGLDGWVTTYQAVAAAPDLHLAEFRQHPTLLVLDEVHHLPAPDPVALATTEAPGGALMQSPRVPPPTEDLAEAGWSNALLPLLETARVRLLLSGTLERADGKRILWLPYRGTGRAGSDQVNLAAPGWAVVGYSRAQALAERAVLPVRFGALDGEARWLEPSVAGAERAEAGPHRLGNSHPTETTRPALFTALRTGYAEALLRRAFEATRTLRAKRRRERGLGGLDPRAPVRGLGKLLVVAPDQAQAERYLGVLRSWVPPAQQAGIAIATSACRDAHQTLAGYRLRSDPSILVTVAMAYEGLDAPEVAVVAALTHIRSRPWLEQMVARATRVDPNAGPYEAQRALVYHPDDPLFAKFRWRMESEQGTLARRKEGGPDRKRPTVPDWLEEKLAAQRAEKGIVPLGSEALGLRYSTLKPGPDLAEELVAAREAADAADVQGSLLETPSTAERRLRNRVGEMVAAQAVEDAGAFDLPQPGLQAARGRGVYHAYNAALKRVLGGKSRTRMTLPELEAALAWLERNRLRDHLHLLEGDPRYLAQQGSGQGWQEKGDWTPPRGRVPKVGPDRDRAARSQPPRGARS